MFEKNKGDERYIREYFTMEEKLFEKYMEMVGVLFEVESYKYYKESPIQHQEAFKQGFLAGVKILSSMLLDI
ncbi:MAG: hypothetical protein E7356_01270 [Clostridiales bacterium]|nr:hypothetical protein [Clostridiales bacterium]